MISADAYGPYSTAIWIYKLMSHARPNIGSITHATRPILVQLHHATRSSLKASEFRNYQRSLFKAKTFIQGWFRSFLSIW